MTEPVDESPAQSAKRISVCLLCDTVGLDAAPSGWWPKLLVASIPPSLMFTFAAWKTAASCVRWKGFATPRFSAREPLFCAGTSSTGGASRIWHATIFRLCMAS